MKPPGSGEATGNVLKQLRKLRPEARMRITNSLAISAVAKARVGKAPGLPILTEVLAAAGAGSNFSRLLARANDLQKSRKAAMWFNRGLVTAILLLGMPASVAQPVPAVGLKGAAPQLAGSVSAASPHCWWRRGQRSCRAYGPARGLNGRSDYFEYDANTLPFGTERWRHQMRRENRLGNPG